MGLSVFAVLSDLSSIKFPLVMQNEYLQASLFLLAAWIFASLVYKFLNTLYVKFARKTETHFDDNFLRMVNLPIYYLILFAGIYLALQSLTFIKSYSGFLNTTFFVLAVLLVAISLSTTINTAFTHWLRAHHGVRKTPKLINKIVSGIIYIIGGLIILDFFNVAITPLLATLGVGALAIGLALQPTLANFFAGLRLLSDKSLNVGDFIEIDANNAGYVEDIGWNTTRIRTVLSNTIVVPNSKIADSLLINNSLPKEETIILVDCGVSYDSNLEKVERVTLDVARQIQKEVPGAVETFQPFMRFSKFAGSNIEFSVRLMVEGYVDKYLVTHEFIKALKKRYDKEGIEISYNVVKSIPATPEKEKSNSKGSKKGRQKRQP